MTSFSTLKTNKQRKKASCKKQTPKMTKWQKQQNENNNDNKKMPQTKQQPHQQHNLLSQKMQLQNKTILKQSKQNG